jgi:peptide/nickel transport system permease protein
MKSPHELAGIPFWQTNLANNLLCVLIIVAIMVSVWGMWRSPVWGAPMRRLARNRTAIASLTILCLYGIVGLMGSFEWSAGPGQPSRTALGHLFATVPVERYYSAPMARYDIDQRHPHKLKGFHILGTDGLGNDVLLNTLRGCRTAWIVGGFTLVMAVPIAIILGITAGYFGGYVDDAIQYFYITLSSIPSILLLITLMMVMGKGLKQICIALATSEWVGLCRYLRGETFKQREKEYVLAARAIGVHPARILMRHILPNVFHLVIISATLSFSGLVMSEAILSYLGVGVPAGIGSWGMMIDDARMELARDPLIWWNLTSAAVALFGLVLAANFFGDAVRDAFDPRLREG